MLNGISERAIRRFPKEWPSVAPTIDFPTRPVDCTQAISTIIHYAVLLLGFFVALAVLGVDFTKVTILAGAFTVGVGFGLQTVINNFVCGLILLFERPIKVGDVVQVDTDIGEVRRIGIRASALCQPRLPRHRRKRRIGCRTAS